MAAPVSLLQVFRVRNRQLHSFIHGHVRVLRHSNNGPVPGGLTQTQNLYISKHLTVTCSLTVLTQRCIVCRGRYGVCVLTVLLTLYTHNRTQCWEGELLCFKIQRPRPLVPLRNVVLKLSVEMWSNDTDSG